MKKTINILLLVMMALMISSVCYGQAENTADAKEMKAKEPATITCDEYLDKFLGSWVAEYSENGKKVVTDLTFKRAIQNQYLQGYWTTKDESGKVVFEQLLILKYYLAVSQYLMYAFESTGWAKTYVGKADPEKVLLQGMLPGGFEHYRWTITPEGNMERAQWNPVEGKPKVEGDPDFIIVFKPVKTK